MTPYDRLIAERERPQLDVGPDLAYFNVLVLSVEDGAYSDADPMGRGITTTENWQTIPGRIVWSGKERPMRHEGSIIFRRAGVTITDIPPQMYSILVPGRVLKVPESTESGTEDVLCRLIEVARDDEQGSLVVYADKVVPSQGT